MKQRSVFVRTLFGIATLLAPAALMAQAKLYPLDTVAGLRLHNVKAEAVTYEGKRGVSVTITSAVPIGSTNTASDSIATRLSIAVMALPIAFADPAAIPATRYSNAATTPT